MLVVVFVVALFVVFVVKYIIKCRQLPPGPIGLPFIGYYPFFGKIPAETVSELSKKYGPVMTINILGDNYWFLNSMEAIEEAFVKNGDLFAGRPYLKEYSLYSLVSTKSSGVIEGDEWKFYHKFTIGNLSLLGMGKTKFEHQIHDLLKRVEEYVDSKEGMANDYYEILTNFSSNVITTLSFSKQYDYNDPEYINIRDWAHNVFSSFAYLNFHLSGLGFRILSLINPKYTKMCKESSGHLKNYINGLINERMETFDANNCRDLIDYFLKEKEGPNGHLFNNKAISGKLAELIFGGTETTSAILYHSLRLMSENEKIQEKVYKEINGIYGTEGVVSFADRHRLPYTQAVISEIHRFVCLVTLVTTHVNREATKLCGFDVPKRSKFIVNFYAVSRNPIYFKNPHEFDPENFLDSNGDYLPNKALIPFSTGIRRCLGATLAEIDIFLAFVRLMQRFQWKKCDSESDGNVDVNEGLVRHLSANKVYAIRRE